MIGPASETTQWFEKLNGVYMING